MDKILSFLGLCKRAGALVAGEDGAGGAARAGEAKLILTSSDASERTTRKAENYASAGGAVLASLPYDKTVIGEILGREVCAVLAITDANFARGMLEKLAGADNAYAPALAELTEHLKSRRERRREKFGDADKI